MIVTIHMTDTPDPIDVTVPNSDLLTALSERFATFETADGAVMLNRDLIVRIDLPADDSES